MNSKQLKILNFKIKLLKLVLSLLLELTPNLLVNLHTNLYKQKHLFQELR